MFLVVSSFSVLSAGEKTTFCEAVLCLVYTSVSNTGTRACPIRRHAAPDVTDVRALFAGLLRECLETDGGLMFYEIIVVN